MEQNRISLNDSLQKRWFLQAMTTLRSHRRELSEYDRGLFDSLDDGYNLVGDAMTLSRKQMNHLKGVAMELEGGQYNGR